MICHKKANSYPNKRDLPNTVSNNCGQIDQEIDRLIGELRKGAKRGLNLGCGDHPIDGLINCDLFSELADVKTDSITLDEFDSASIDYIESHHMIEHLSFAEAERALKEWRRILKPNGVLVLTCPDLTEVAKLWLDCAGTKTVSKSKEDRDYILKMLYGSQEHPGMFHRSGYDAEKMCEILTEQGFRILFTYTPYPVRPTPSLLIVAEKRV